MFFPVVAIGMFFLVAFCDGMRLQSVGARGEIMCGNRPDSGAKIRLYDEDDGKADFHFD